MQVSQGTCSCNDISFGTVDDILDGYTLLIEKKESSSKHIINKPCDSISESVILDKDRDTGYKQETCKVNETFLTKKTNITCV